MHRGPIGDVTKTMNGENGHDHMAEPNMVFDARLRG